MSTAVISIITGIAGLLGGAFGFFLITGHLEKRSLYLASKRLQLKKVYAPLEILVKINAKEFDHYFKHDATIEDREFIEKTIWHPNYLEIKKIIMKSSHILESLPDELLRLLNYINIWLADFDAVYIRRMKDPPVFVRPDGYSYPGESDEFIYQQSEKLRKLLNR